MTDVGAILGTGDGSPERICACCGARSGSDGRFCSECGARLVRADRSAEFKQVTVLFADVVRSMDIAAAVDIERLREIMTAVVERSAAVAHRYGGTVEYNGDGVMAIFGAPIALEDHAFRACAAGLAIQDEMKRLAADVRRLDGVALAVRVGLNSGRVIAGNIGSGSLGYAATGQHVGLAQRMESAASAGGVLVSESTARLVEGRAVLSEPEWVAIKGSDETVPARRLVAIAPRRAPPGRVEARLVGRRVEMATLDAVVGRALAGRGGVVNVVGPPGIGKSRAARETAALAAGHGVRVCWTFCESHASDVPFGVVTQLLRARLRVTDLDGETARARVREQLPRADPAGLLLLDDLLGIADSEAPPPVLDADTRRRRLTAVINAASLARSEPLVFIVEDAQWVDVVSESMLTDFLSVIPQTPSVVLITSRPEYRGALTRLPDAQTLTLAPLSDSDTAALIGELLGPDPSVTELGRVIAERAAGNPFFAEEMVREMAQRGALVGEHGRYLRRADVADVAVPATVQAAIEARIDRLSATAKRTLHAASVIGARFAGDLLAALGRDVDADVGFEVDFEELLGAELIEQVRFAPNTEYAFRHPLIRAVSYESQLTSDRADWHRRLASAIQDRSQASADENAALIAEHLEAAGEPLAAYGWHMRAGAWLTNRDLPAARVSWQRAGRIADTLPADDSDELSMRIAPRTMLCATDLQARDAGESQRRFAELQELCGAAGDSVSLAIGMSGPATELMYAGRVREAARVASEQVALLETIADPSPAMGLAAVAFCSWLGVMRFDEILRWSQTIVELADGDPVKGAGYGVGSPLAIALAWRGTSRWFLGGEGWRRDLHDAVAMARRSNPETLSNALAWTYGIAMQYGALRADDAIIRVSEEAVHTARAASSDRAVGLAVYTLGVALLTGDDAAERRRGLELMMEARAVWLRRSIRFLIPVTDVWAARESARDGDRDGAIAVMRRAVDELREGYPFYCVWAIGVLVETLLDRAGDGDLAAADAAFDRLAELAPGRSSVLVELTTLRLRALLARARGDGPAFLESALRYRTRAESLGVEGHTAWAEELVGTG